MRIDRLLRLPVVAALARGRGDRRARRRGCSTISSSRSRTTASTKCRRLLARGMDPDSVDAKGDTLLCIAARNGSARTVEALLAAKANPNRANRFGDTPLMLAALNGDLDTRPRAGRGRRSDQPAAAGRR